MKPDLSPVQPQRNSQQGKRALSSPENKSLLLKMILMDNKDVMMIILLRLPLKSLLRCKCVCKWWKSLIFDHDFSSIYTTQNPQLQVSGFFLQKFLYLEPSPKLEFFALDGPGPAAPEPSLSFIQDSEGVYIRHCSNGLVLCSTFRCTESDRKYYICKPTTKQYQALPSPQCSSVSGVYIVFDPSISSHYKVICVSDFESSKDQRLLKLFDSTLGFWRVSRDPVLVPHDMLFDRGVLLNGALHWIGTGNVALRFDVDREWITSMPMPPKPEERSERRIEYFGESGGSLYLIEIYAPRRGFDVMEMKSDYSGWFAKYHIDLSGLAIGPRFSVLHLVKRQVGDQDESYLVLHIPGGFVSYHFRDGGLTELQNLSNEVMTVDRELGLWYSWQGVYPYTNTLCYL